MIAFTDCSIRKQETSFNLFYLTLILEVSYLKNYRQPGVRLVANCLRNEFYFRAIHWHEYMNIVIALVLLVSHRGNLRSYTKH